MKKKEPRQPGWFSMILASLLSLWLGVLLAIGVLAVRDVEEVRADRYAEMNANKEVVPGKVYFVAGTERDGSEYTTRRQQLAANEGTITVTEGELNTYARRTFQVNPQARSDTRATRVYFDPPNFRFTEDNKLQIATKVHIGALGEKAVVVQSTGDLAYDKGDGVIRYQPETMKIGNAPVPAQLSFIADAFVDKIGATFTDAALAEAWKKITNAKIEDQKLVIVNP